MTEPRTHGQTKSGEAIADADIESLADEAERGYDVDALIARRGKPRPPSSRHSASISRVGPSRSRASRRPRRAGNCRRSHNLRAHPQGLSGSTCVRPDNVLAWINDRTFHSLVSSRSGMPGSADPCTMFERGPVQKRNPIGGVPPLTSALEQPDLDEFVRNSSSSILRLIPNLTKRP